MDSWALEIRSRRRFQWCSQLWGNILAGVGVASVCAWEAIGLVATVQRCGVQLTSRQGRNIRWQSQKMGKLLLLGQTPTAVRDKEKMA